MAILTSCPGCSARFRLEDHLAGKKVRCQKCSHIFRAPLGASEASAASGQDVPLAAVVVDDQPMVDSSHEDQSGESIVPRETLGKVPAPRPKREREPEPEPEVERARRSRAVADDLPRSFRRRP